MREVFRRRFGRLVREGGSGETTVRPDLVLIDGGGGQLGAALEILTELGYDAAGIAALRAAGAL
jgi:excinuclease ABC subunit C